MARIPCSRPAGRGQLENRVRRQGHRTRRDRRRQRLRGADQHAHRDHQLPCPPRPGQSGRFRRRPGEGQLRSHDHARGDIHLAGSQVPEQDATAEPTNAATDSRIATRPTPPDTSTACAIQAIETTTSFTTIRPNTTKRARSIDPVHVPPEPRATAALGAHASPATRTTSRAPTKRQPRPDYHSTAQSGTAVMSRTAGT